MPNLIAAMTKPRSTLVASRTAPTNASSPLTVGAMAEGRFLGDVNEERTRHSIRSIDSGLGESDDPTQVDKEGGTDVSLWCGGVVCGRGQRGMMTVYLLVCVHSFMCVCVCVCARAGSFQLHDASISAPACVPASSQFSLQAQASQGWLQLPANL